MEDERLAAEREKLFRHRAAHAKAPSGGRDKSHGVVIHDWSLTIRTHHAKRKESDCLRNLGTPRIPTDGCGRSHGRSVR